MILCQRRAATGITRAPQPRNQTQSTRCPNLNTAQRRAQTTTERIQLPTAKQIMSNQITSWDNDYARLARAASQLRTTTAPNSPFNNDASRQGQASSIQTGIGRLESQLNGLEANLTLTPAEASRRRNLLDGLRSQLGGGGASSGLGVGGGFQTATAAALRQQDDMIDQLAVGVGRLKNQTRMIQEETRAHVGLLDEMDNNVSWMLCYFK